MKKFLSILLSTLLVIGIGGTAVMFVKHRKQDNNEEPKGMAVLCDTGTGFKIGDKIIIVSVADNVALGTTQNKNNRAVANVERDGSLLTFGEDAQVLELRKGYEENGEVTSDGYSFFVGNGLLYTTTNNTLKTSDVIHDKSTTWTITIDESGDAHIVSTLDHSTILYNKDVQVFSCYNTSSSQLGAVQIYKVVND